MSWLTTLPWLWIAAGAAALSAAVAACWLWRSRPWRGPRTRWPVVLVHGVLGFDEIGLGNHRQSYFRGVPERLEALGVRLYRPRLPALGTVAMRARALADALEEIPERRVNIIAHSMGGLDARLAISRLGCADRVASLTTIGTPHRGTPLADLGSAILGERFGLGPLLARTGLSLEAIHELSERRLVDFDRQAPDARRVRYLCVLAEAGPNGQGGNSLLRLSKAFLQRRAGANDGLVPVASQLHGTVLQRIEADHWAQIGWASGFDAPAFYERLLNQLRARGL